MFLFCSYLYKFVMPLMIFKIVVIVMIKIWFNSLHGWDSSSCIKINSKRHYLHTSIEMRKILHPVEMSDYPRQVDVMQFYFGYFGNHLAYIELLKNNNRNIRKMCEICSKSTIKNPERRKWRRYGVFIVNFEHISQLFLVFLLLTLSK